MWPSCLSRLFFIVLNFWYLFGTPALLRRLDQPIITVELLLWVLLPAAATASSVSAGFAAFGSKARRHTKNPCEPRSGEESKKLEHGVSYIEQEGSNYG